MGQNASHFGLGFPLRVCEFVPAAPRDRAGAGGLGRAAKRKSPDSTGNPQEDRLGSGNEEEVGLAKGE